MKNSILLVLCFLITESLSAQYMGGDLSMGGGTVSGPVKKVTFTTKQHLDPLDTLKCVAFFDTNRNIVKTGYYKGKKLIIDGIYKYSDHNSCVHYMYDENGTEDTHYSEIFFDANGKELLKFRYWKDKLTQVDSMVYNPQGLLIAKYVSEYMERTPLLRVVYAYDSIGRLIMEQNVRTGEKYTISISYMPNGNYVKTIYRDGRTETETCILNETGQLIECKSKDKSENFSHYDEYGNWHKRVGRLNTHSIVGWIGSTTERIIEYY